MNEVIRAMVQRRSIRKYKPDMVPKALIDQVIEAGLYAPSARGLQSPVIIAVTNRELAMQSPKKTAKSAAGMPDLIRFMVHP